MLSKIFLSSIFFLINSVNLYAAEGQGGMPQLNPSTYSSQLFWLTIFFFLILFLNHFLFLPKLEKIRLNRKNTIDGYVKEAKEINDSIIKIIDQMENDLKRAKDEYNSLLKDTYEKNKAFYDEEIKKINVKVEKKKITFSNDLRKTEESLRKSIPKICIELSDKLYENIMDEKKSGSIKEFEELYRGR